jgi:hypothetical protein
MEARVLLSCEWDFLILTMMYLRVAGCVTRVDSNSELMYISDPVGRAVSGAGLKSLECWNREFVSR